MAINLFAKKLMKRPIGAQVELTIENGSSLEKVSGVITDSDFTTSVEITTPEGNEILLDYSLVKGFQETKSLISILKELTEGTSVRFSYGDESEREPNCTGRVGENDGEESLEILTSDGRDLVLTYSIIRSLIVQTGQAPLPDPKPIPVPPVPKPKSIPAPAPQKFFLYNQEPEDFLNLNDAEMKEIFDRLPLGDKKRLTSVFDSFKYGIKVSDREKQAGAAKLARQILFREEDSDYYWSRDAVVFVGSLLRRVSIYDWEVYLVAECFEEAAFAALHESRYDLAGAYAITALLENTRRVRDMAVILACSVVSGNDISGLRIFSQRLPAGMEPQLKALVSDAFSAKGIQLSAEQDMDAALNMLSSLYTADAMGGEVTAWLPKEPSKQSGKTAVRNEPEKKTEPECTFGIISRLNWSDHTGTVTADDGTPYTFRYKDISDAALAKEIRECLRSDLGGKVHTIKFFAENGAARNIQPDNTLVERARALAANTSLPDRFARAFDLCRRAVESCDARRALGDLVKYAISLYKASQDTRHAREAISLFEKNSAVYPRNPHALMDVAQCYSCLKKYPQMIEYAQKSIDFPGLPADQNIPLVSQYLNMIREDYEVSGDKALLTRILKVTDNLKKRYSADFEKSSYLRKQYTNNMLPHRIFAACGLDLLEDAEADYAQIPEKHTYKAPLDRMMADARARLAPPEETAEEAAEIIADQTADEAIPDLGFSESDFDDAAEEETPEEVVPYADTDGWDALKLSKKEVIDYALNITGPDRIPSILAYLRAGSSLNNQIRSVYHTVALAANDPLEAPDYSITALVNALAGSDTDYPMLNDCCMGAAFLRASFLSGRGYDYSAQGLRDSISISQQIPSLRDACDTLEVFRKEAGRAIDIYADYRNHGVRKLMEDLDATVRHADELYTKFILTPAREGAKFARLLDTKKIVFSRDGYLATMLRHILDRNTEALEAEKDNFIAKHLTGNTQLSAKHINPNSVDDMIVACWELAGKNMQLKKQNATLQGDRRNNLRSNINEILTTICQWYALSEQSAGLTWRTGQGEDAYQRLRPQLLEQLEAISDECAAEMESSPDPELNTGLFLLSSTARELSARLDGSWRFDQEKFMYVDFLRSNHIMLDENLMPELSSTFCVLPEFNVLARIRAHAENPKLTFQEQIDRIFGMDKTCNNYGTAQRILAYLETIGERDSVTLPESPEQFISHTEMQIDMRFRSFRETYALAMSYGQIIKSDAFCYALENTVRYWYTFCKETKNYGFFTSILLQAENQIHASAQQYEIQLEEQLDALVSGNRQYFDEHTDYAEAIRTQISNQNFTVAEDWMARIRIGDFSLDMQQPEALAYLDEFWSEYLNIYNTVVDTGKTLSAALKLREGHNKDTRGGKQLIDCWPNSASHPDRICQLMNLLGWHNIRVSRYEFAAELNTEIYEVCKEKTVTGLSAPLHPIAAFGSGFETKPIYVVCLYGNSNCNRLYEKMRAMDVIDGNKIFLLDSALGQVDRRALAHRLKKRESALRSVNILIDRVLITHLAKKYNKDLINRILMAIAMPFSYCQPYVVESIHTMPPEIFIGRKEELTKIEDAEGVNLIYGGRQLGKSALFKKALADIDGRDKQRAVLIDINQHTCAQAARKVSEELIDLGILTDAEPTEDWDVLCRNITRRLRDPEADIAYFLLMLDESDKFIEDCANYDYRPMAALKDIQQSLPRKFKYVLAGLHSVVKFNRQVALGNNSVIPHIPSLKITPFHTPEAQELLTNPLSYLGFSLPSKVTVSQILATCNYFPGLIQLYAKKLIESVRAADYAGYDFMKTPPYVVSDEHLRRVMADKEFVEEIHNKFEATLTLDQKQGSHYYPLTLLIGWMYNIMPSKSGYTAKDVLSHARDLSIHPLNELDEDKMDALLQELQDLNILRSISNNSYLLASKNFRDLLGSDEEIFEKLMQFGGVAG